MPSQYAFNSWPDRVTWLIASWLGPVKYGYVVSVAAPQWTEHRGSLRRSMQARTGVAEKIARDLPANVALVELSEADPVADSG